MLNLTHSPRIRDVNTETPSEMPKILLHSKIHLDGSQDIDRVVVIVVVVLVVVGLLIFLT